MPTIEQITEIKDRERLKFCNVQDEIGIRTCSFITNDSNNPVPVSVQYEGVGEAGFKCDNILVSANVIQTLVLENGLSTIEIYCRGNGVVEWNLDNATLTSFNTIPSGCEYSKSDLRLSGKTLYFRCDKALTVEIRQWTST